MSERKELTLEGIRRFHEDGAQTQRRLTKQAAAMGGLVLIHVPLPFKLPLQDGFRMGWDDDEAKFLELIHYPKETSDYIGEPIFSGNISPIQMPLYPGSMRTVVRFGKPVTLETFGKTLTAKAHPNFRPVIDRFPDDFKIEISQTLGDLLDEGLVALNFLIRSYRILEKDFIGGPVEGIESLPNNLFYTVWDIANVKNLDLGVQILRRQDVVQMGEGLLLVHASLQVDQQTVGYERTGKIVVMTSGALEGDPHPFFVSTDLVQSARSKLSQGDYNSAVIDAATGIEAYVHAFAKLDMESRNVSQDKISGRLRSGFRNVVEKHFANRLGLAFDPDQPSNSVDVWYSSAYKLRNKVVHEGRTATRSEARKAVNETLDFLDLTAQCVKNNLGEFSEVWKYLR